MFEKNIEKIKEYIDAGVKIQRDKMRMLRYTDDIPLLSENEEGLKEVRHNGAYFGIKTDKRLFADRP